MRLVFMKQFTLLISSIFWIFLILAESLFKSRCVFLVSNFMLFDLVPHCLSLIYFLLYHSFWSISLILNLLLLLNFLLVLFFLLLLSYILLFFFLLLFFILSLFSLLGFLLLFVFDRLLHLYLHFLINILYFFSSSCNISSHIYIDILNFCDMDWAHHEIDD